MLSDDVYRAKLVAAYAGIARLCEDLSDVADIDTRQENARLRVALAPTMRSACPVELMVRADQRYDIEIGSEFYEDCEVASLDLFEELIRAIAAGSVVTRHYFSAATGSLRSVETIVTLPGGRTWRRGHRIVPDRRPFESGDGAGDGEGTVVKDRTFLPYRR